MISRYQSAAMKTLWSDEHKFATWFLVERVYLAAYMRHKGMHDEPLLVRLKQAEARIDWQRFSTRVAHYDEEVKHDVIAFLHALEDELHDDSRLIHSGLTSSDIVDTAFAYLLRSANDNILLVLQRTIEAMWLKAKAFRGVLCLGRTHGQAAEPTTFGLKLLGHAVELKRNYDRLKRVATELAVGKLSGAVGVYAHTTPAIEAETLGELGLVPETVATQVVARDRHAHYFATLATLAGSIERFALEIRLLMHGQVKEAFEPFAAKQKGSSAMPHKKNPILSENLTGLMRMIRSYALAALENQGLWHERDISHSSVERIIAPDATSLMEFALLRLHSLVTNMVVDTDRLQLNLDDAGSVLKSQALMIALVDAELPRQRAYEMVQAAALSRSGSFRDRVRVVGIEDILGAAACDAIVASGDKVIHEDAIFARAEELLRELSPL